MSLQHFILIPWLLSASQFAVQEVSQAETSIKPEAPIRPEVVSDNSPVVVMTDSQQFMLQVTTLLPVGTISSVYNLIYSEIGVPNQFTLLPLNRQNRALDQREYAACTLYRFKTKAREARYAFSKPIYFLLHYQLYQQHDLAPLSEDLLDEKGRVRSLKAVTQANENSAIIVMPNYSYGDYLDEQLAALPDKAKIDWSGNNPHNRLSTMFFKKRGDFALMFPQEVGAYLQKNPDVTYRSYQFAGIDNKTHGYMMCNKHPDSYEYIDRVNTALANLYNTPAYLAAHVHAYSQTEGQNVAHTMSRFIAEIETGEQ